MSHIDLALIHLASLDSFLFELYFTINAQSPWFYFVINHFFILKGMLIAESEVVNDQKTVLNLWKHECTRVIADRFISLADKEWFEKAIKLVLEEDLGHEVASTVDAEPFFVDFLRDAPEMTGIDFFIALYKNLICRIQFLTLFKGIEKNPKTILLEPFSSILHCDYNAAD